MIFFIECCSISILNRMTVDILYLDPIFLPMSKFILCFCVHLYYFYRTSFLFVIIFNCLPCSGHSFTPEFKVNFYFDLDSKVICSTVYTHILLLVVLVCTTKTNEAEH